MSVDKKPVELKGPIAISEELFQGIVNELASLPASVSFNAIKALTDLPAGATRSLDPNLFGMVVSLLNEQPAKRVYFLITELLDDAREALAAPSTNSVIAPAPVAAPAVAPTAPAS